MLWTYVISEFNVKKFFEQLMKKKLQKSNQKGFRFEKEIKRKGDIC